MVIPIHYNCEFCFRCIHNLSSISLQGNMTKWNSRSLPKVCKFNSRERISYLEPTITDSTHICDFVLWNGIATKKKPILSFWIIAVCVNQKMKYIYEQIFTSRYLSVHHNSINKSNTNFRRSKTAPASKSCF